ncbi:hypothetical protein [Xanthomonas oryzae]|nr:hypothetical protein [Xanthomonas oryzae]WDZ28113.1 hypothetical protein NO561_23060 [Xanthomonas oryzae pv. oryzae]WFC25254.1 hypothetical protein PEV90_02965 [Xanthomonas oryzae pv. oryzae]
MLKQMKNVFAHQRQGNVVRHTQYNRGGDALPPEAAQPGDHL